MDGDHGVTATAQGAQTCTLQVVRKGSGSDLVAQVDAALTNAMLCADLESVGIYRIPGMSGKRYRHFINHLVGAIADARYLEIGSWAGSTLCSAIHGNKVWAVAIDNWSQFGGPKKAFLNNVKKFRTVDAEVIFIESDFRKVDYRDMQRGFNMYLFDGPHGMQDQYDGLAMPLPALDDHFVFVVDDWNWEPVRTSTRAAIARCGLNVLYSAEIRTTLDGKEAAVGGRYSDWHNGYFISVLEKPKSAIAG